MSEARKATEEDIPFLVSLARQSYPQYPLEHAEAFAQRIISLPNAAMFISGEAVATVAAQFEFWNPTRPVSDVLPMFGRPSKENPLGAYKALTAAAQWSHDIGCYGMRFGSSLGASSRSNGRNAVDLMEPFAHRLGARLWGTTYLLEFAQCRPQSH